MPCKTALITGANRGIGLGHARYCLQQGYRVFATARTPEESTAFDELEREYSSQFRPVALDVTSEESLADLSSLVAGESLDLVISNAGIAIDQNFSTWTAQTYLDHMHVNTIGPALLAQAVSPYMPERGKLINITSGMGSLQLNLNPEMGLDAYAMSKAALNMLTRRLASKLQPMGIIVVSLNPGWVQTSMGGLEAPDTVEEAVSKMQEVINSLTPAQSGAFLSEMGEEMPW